MWDPSTGELHAEHVAPGRSGGEAAVRGLSFAPDGRRLAAVWLHEDVLRVLDSTTGEVIVTVDDVGAPPFPFRTSFSPDGREIAVPSFARERAISDDGRLVATSNWEGATRLFNRSGREAAQLPVTPGHAAKALAVSPDGATVAVAEDPVRPGPDGHVLLWDVEQRRVLHTMDGRATNVAFSADGRRLAIAHEDGAATIWSTRDGSLVATLTGHLGAVLDVQYADDGAVIATAGRDGTVRLLDADSGTPRLVLPGQDNVATAAAFTADGRTLASAAQDGVARVWALDVDDLISIAQGKLTRGFTGAECREYLHVEACPGS